MGGVASLSGNVKAGFHRFPRHSLVFASGGEKIRQIRRLAESDKKDGRICRENA
jgi:hypothetical protein